MFQYITTLVLILIVWILLKYMKWRRQFYYHLEKIGGPRAYPVLGNLDVFFGVQRSDIFDLIDNINKERGPIFRSYNIFKPEVTTMKPEHFEKIMSSSVHIRKGRFYRPIREWLGDGLLVSDGAKWHQRRKMITPAFHFKILESFVKVFVEKSKLLVEYLEEKGDGKSFDVYPYLTHCTLDVICETAMGVSINALSHRHNSYPQTVHNTCDLIMRKQISVFKQTPFYSYLEDGKMFYRNLNKMRKFADEVIADRRKTLKENPIRIRGDDVAMTRKKRLSFLDLLLDASDTLTDEDIKAEVNTFMFLGHDTTASAITWTIYLLGLNPDVQEKAYQEVKHVLRDRKAPESISDLNELKYLEYCIKETLRLYPVVPVIARHLTEDITLAKYKIPKGTDCILNIYQVHRNRDAFPDPEKFDLDRFLPENSKNRHPYAYVPFSAGPRNCIGQKYAMYEEKTVLASILRSFKIIPVDTPETLKRVSEIVIRPQEGLNIALQKRTD